MKKLSTLLSAIAIIAIAWYIITFLGIINNWWILPLLAGVTGLFSAFLPVLMSRFKVFWSIVSTGITLLLIQTLPNFLVLNPSTKFWVLIIFIFLISLITEGLAHGLSAFHPGSFILDFLIALVAAWLVSRVGSSLAVLIMLLIAFICVIIFDFNFNFSIRKKENIEDYNTDEHSDNNVE